ncbi:Protein trichome birefringence-like [Arachis hypogaea]|nr:Protein trichome birefringence-like [Arachis hypogaea]
MNESAPKGLFSPEPEHYRGPKLKVAIIGAGLSGMSTTVELLDQGHESQKNTQEQNLVVHPTPPTSAVFACCFTNSFSSILPAAILSCAIRGCYFQQGMEVKMEMKVEDAYRKSMETVLNWIQDTVDLNKSQVFFRTYAPVHFRSGDWRSGGSCHLKTLPELNLSLVPNDNWSQFKIGNSLLSSHKNSTELVKLKILNITEMTAQRKDGHSSIYYLGPNGSTAALHRQDCSHWCLSGVPDTWNELLYAMFMKHEGFS